MYSYGISGGIGSGKSFICNLLENMGYPVFYSDVEAKKNMLHNIELIGKITKTFGKETYIDGKINKNYLTNLIFSDPKAKSMLNKIIHPTVYQSFDEWKKLQNSKIVFNESALLFETGSFVRFDKVVLVSAPLDLRIKRIIKRDKISKKIALNKILAQWSDEKNRKYCNYEIVNDENLAILPQIWNVLPK